MGQGRESPSRYPRARSPGPHSLDGLKAGKQLGTQLRPHGERVTWFPAEAARVFVPASSCSVREFSPKRGGLFFLFFFFFSPSKVGSASATYASRESAALEGGSFRLDTLDSRVSEIVCLLRREDQSAWVWTSAVCLTCFTALTGRLFSCSSSLSRGHERSRKRGTASPPVRWRTGLVGRSRGLRDPAGAVVK